jgi:TonB family protein
MSYYAVDLLSVVPAGSTGGGSAAVTPAEPAPPPEPVRSLPREAIKVADKKHPPKPVRPPPTKPATKTTPKVPSWAQTDSFAQDEAAKKPSNVGASGAAAAAGQPFPYPWYLKTVSDRLEKQWRPPEEFQTNTACQVRFVIQSNGQVSGVKIAKPSGDAFFDQLALRAVLDAGAMPPLPSGFNESELRVFMTFEGKK